ncbi:MAG: adenine deaminase [Burkholderiales bacterium]|nr:MAG: adenine deaminase [Burkholderiales bacterium]
MRYAVARPPLASIAHQLNDTLALRSDSASGSISINRIDLATSSISAGQIEWQDGRITAWHESGPADPALPYLAPGLIDAHVHIESSLLPPSEFARLAVRQGTIAAISDPHEIANVLGMEGVHFMLDDAAATPFHFLFGAPSCVPATHFESAGASLGVSEIEALLATPGIGYLSEVMNFPGVLDGEPEVLAKIAAARSLRRPVDGHAPGLTGEAAGRYAAAGITTDHECVSLAEAQDKLAAGMKILLREGSAARDFEALHPLLTSHPGQVMFCTDDCHPDDLALGHINRMVARAVAQGHDIFSVLRAASQTPQEHYGWNLGLLAPGDAMNAVLFADLRDFEVLATWLDGQLVAERGRCLLPRRHAHSINRFAARPIRPSELRIDAPVGADFAECQVIEAADGELITRRILLHLPCVAGFVPPRPSEDVLLLAVANRYEACAPAVALIRGFGLKDGALASSVAHDSHNVIGVGCDADALARAMNAVIESRGGLAVVSGQNLERLPLPFAGLMSDQPGEIVADRYALMTHLARDRLGSPLRAPFMTLSFMALLVIPELKLSDRGLFDGKRFAFTHVPLDDSEPPSPPPA